MRNKDIHYFKVYILRGIVCLLLILEVHQISSQTVLVQSDGLELHQTNFLHNKHLLLAELQTFAFQEKIYDPFYLDELGIAHYYEDLLRIHPEYASAQGPVYENRIVDNTILNTIQFRKGMYALRKKNTQNARQYFGEIDPTHLDDELRMDYQFYYGYSLFINKEFHKARQLLSKLTKTRGTYYFPANYYTGMVDYFNEKYKDAADHLEKVSHEIPYSRKVPYYLVQIYFAEGDYDKTIRYGESLMNSSRIDEIDNIKGLIGQSYYQKERYDKALVYLDDYAKSATEVSPEELYQLGFLHLQQKNYAQAEPYFEELAVRDGEIGILSAYNLAQIYLSTSQKDKAFSALQSLTSKTLPEKLQSEAVWQLAQVASELEQYPASIRAVLLIDEESPYYNKSRELLTKALIESKDYQQAISIIESIPSKDDEIKELYQILSYQQATSEYKSGNYQKAKSYLEKTRSYDIDPLITANSYFWIANILAKEGKRQESNLQYSHYLKRVKNRKTPNFESSLAIAHYNIAYNYLASDNLHEALPHFELAGESFPNNYDKNQQRILEDIELKMGDIFLENNNYGNALSHYNKVLSLNQPTNADYAFLQTAMIKGVVGDYQTKRQLLQRLIKNYSKSDYRDDALFYLAKQYQDEGIMDDALSQYTVLVHDYGNESPKYSEALLQMALIYYNKGDIDRAALRYKEVLDSNPNTEIKHQAALALKEIYVDDKKNPDEYFDLLEENQDLENLDDYTRDSIRYQVAIAPFAKKNYTQATSTLRQYIDNNKKGAFQEDATFLLAQAYLEINQLDKSIEAYRKLAPPHKTKYEEDALKNLANLYYHKQKNYTEAKKYYQLLLDYPNDSKELEIIHKGILYSSYQSDLIDSEAIESAKYLLKLEDFDPKAIELSNYLLGKEAYETKNYQAAESFFKKITDTNSVLSAEAHYLIAENAYRQKNWTDAERLANNVTIQFANHHYWVAKSIILLSDIYQEKSEKFRAKAALEAILQNYTNTEDGIVEVAKQKLDKLESDIQSNSRIIDAQASDTLLLDYQNK